MICQSSQGRLRRESSAEISVTRRSRMSDRRCARGCSRKIDHTRLMCSSSSFASALKVWITGRGPYTSAQSARAWPTGTGLPRRIVSFGNTVSSSSSLFRYSTCSLAIEAKGLPPIFRRIFEGAVWCQGGFVGCSAMPLRSSSEASAAIDGAVALLAITDGIRTSSRRRATVAIRWIGAITIMRKKAQASASVTGNPRRNRFHPGSGM